MSNSSIGDHFKEKYGEFINPPCSDSTLFMFTHQGFFRTDRERKPDGWDIAELAQELARE